MIPSAAIESLRHASLPALVADYVKPLRRSGQRWTARCPFHREKTASFTVWDDHFHCFGCGASGSAIDFLMKAEHLRFPEAAKALADRMGVSLESSRLTAQQARMAAQNAEFCRWWWGRKLEAVQEEIYIAVEMCDDSFAEALGKVLRYFRGLSVKQRLEVFQRESTARDRADWEADVRYERQFKEGWMGLRWGMR